MHRPRHARTSDPRSPTSIAAVFDFAWDAGVFRADHAIAALRFTRATVLSSLDRLIALGLIRELAGENPNSRLGRPARHFELRGEAGLLVGVDAGIQEVRAVAADLTGCVIASRCSDVPDPPGDRRWRAILEIVDEVVAAAGGQPDDVAALTIGTPPANRGESSSRGAGADLCSTLSRRFPAVRVENDAALAALAEGSVGAAHGYEHFVALLSGEGLGAGVVLGGSLVHGARGRVGDLEALRSMTGVGGTGGFRNTAALGTRLGHVCGVLARFYDPHRIVVCGAMVAELEEAVEIARQHLATDLELPPPEILTSTLGNEVISLGAIAAAREDARRNFPVLFLD